MSFLDYFSSTHRIMDQRRFFERSSNMIFRRFYAIFRFKSDAAFVWALLIFFISFFACRYPAMGTCNDADDFKAAADLLNRGLYLEAMGRYREVATHSDDPNSRARALLFIGNTYNLYLDQHESALIEFENIIKTYPHSQAASDALFTSAVIFYEIGSYQTAYDLFVRYTQKYPQGMRRLSAEIYAQQAKDRIGSARPQKPVFDQAGLIDRTMRVLIKENADSISLKAVKNLTVSDLFSGKWFYRGSGPVVFKTTDNWLSMNGQRLNTRACRVTSDSPAIELENWKCRGFFAISAQPNGLCVINHIPIEHYLYGVVPKEMPCGWAEEALKAQAIAARTYALYIKSKNSSKEYDLETTATTQAYGGYDAETVKTNKAVDATRDRVMTFNGRIIIAYFHANSAGHTEDAVNVWGVEIPYLKGVPDSFSANIPEGRWACFVPYETLRSRLNRNGCEIGKIRNLKLLGKSLSGRVLNILVVSDQRTSLLTSNRFRIMIGGTDLKSTLFQCRPSGRGIIFEGRGYGHGVGMSQWGANRMAHEGFTCDHILKHYYHDIEITTLCQP
jgi:stage II sporulation protein D